MQEKQDTQEVQEMTPEDIEKLEFIDKVKDATGRTYKGYYDKDEATYHLVYKTDGELDSISKKSSDIYSDLYDPFAELKFIHGN